MAIDASLKFVEKARKIHGNKYDYSKVNYINAQTKVKITCPEHGEFWQKPNNHLNGKSCPLCSESHGEREIRKLLDKYGIRYEREKTFDDLNGIGGGQLRFDFYLPDHNMCIEFDGEQHRQYIQGMQTKHTRCKNAQFGRRVAREIFNDSGRINKTRTLFYRGRARRRIKSNKK